MSNTPKEPNEVSLFADLNDDDLIEIDGNNVKVKTPISIHGTSNGNITIEIHIPARGTTKRHQETGSGGLCEHEHEILTKSLSDMVRKILDHRFGDGTNGSIDKTWATPVVTGPLTKTDVKALMKKGLAIVGGKKDGYDA